MKQQFLLSLPTWLWAFVLGLPLLCACSSDEDEGGTHHTTSSMLELPRPHAGGNNLTVTHRTDKYGVNFTVEWDCDKRAQRWTAYKLHAGNSVTNWNRNYWDLPENGGRDPFQADPALPAAVRTEDRDYNGTGYNRGHICPSADRLNSKEANEQTFYMSNIQPQRRGFNGGVWLNMENRLRKWNENSFRDTLYIVKGGTIDSPENIITHIGPSGRKFPVPKYFFMAILCKNRSASQGGYKAMAFWAEHKENYDEDLKKYVISIDELERRTGIDFFYQLPDAIEAQVESNLVTAAWKFN